MQDRHQLTMSPDIGQHDNRSIDTHSVNSRWGGPTSEIWYTDPLDQIWHASRCILFYGSLTCF